MSELTERLARRAAERAAAMAAMSPEDRAAMQEKTKQAADKPATSTSSTSAPVSASGIGVTYDPITGIPSDSDFEPSLPDKRQSIGMLFGDVGTGKSFIGAHCPGIISFQNFDGRARQVVKEAQAEGRIIWPMELRMPAKRMSDADLQVHAKSITEKVIRNLEIVARESDSGKRITSVIDTGTELSAIFDQAYDGKRVYGKDKDFVNQQWDRMFNLCRNSSFHLIILARVKEIWEKNSATGQNEPTGKYIFRGPDKMHEGVDWSCQTLVSTERNKKGKKVTVFKLRVLKAGTAASQMNEVYTSDMWEPVGGPFAFVSSMMYDGTLPEEWL